VFIRGQAGLFSVFDGGSCNVIRIKYNLLALGRVVCVGWLVAIIFFGGIFTSYVKNINMIPEFTETNFESEVVKAEVPVLVDFTSKTCAPCRSLMPMLEQLSNEYKGEVKIGKVDVAAFPLLGARFGVEMLPTLVFFNQGNVVERMIGIQPKSKIQNVLDDIE
jgi:thioredoxin 1